MIRISKPIVREVDRKVFLVSYMSDNKSKTEVNPNGEEVFYATTKDYGQYLTNESSDCFVVGILLMAIKLGQACAYSNTNIGSDIWWKRNKNSL